MKRVISIIALLIIPQMLSATTIKSPEVEFGVICPWGGIKDAGVQWVRCGAGCTALDWGAIEKGRGVYDWTNADNEVKSTLAENGAILPILGYSPKWASSGPNGEGAYPPKDLKDWSDFVYRIVSRYKDRISYWEIWNEEDIGFFKGTAQQYTDMLKSAYIAAKRADPSCKVVLGGTAGVNLPFIEQVYQNGGGYYFDVMACHPYQWGDTFDDEWFSAQLRDLHQLMTKHGDGGKEVWLTELGWSTGDKAITNDIQARLLVQAFITSFSLRDAGVRKAFWFSVKDWGGPGYGLIADNGERKPAFLAYRWFMDVFRDAVYLRPYKADGLRCHLFIQGGHVMLATWSPDKTVRQLRLPEGMKWTKYQRMMKPVETLNESRISVGPEPIVVYSDTWTPFSRPPVEPRKARSIPPVWYSIQVPEGTSRPYVIRGRRSVISIRVHNDSEWQEPAQLSGRLGAFRSAVQTLSLAPGEVRDVELSFDLPAQYRRGLEMLNITGKGINLTAMQVRITDGPSIEFPANSTVENLYLIEDKGSGGAPSVRFNGMWTYKFDLSDAKGAALDLCVGAHQANEWRVLLSSDRKNWTTALSGKSNRSRHSIDLTTYSGGPIFVKFEGSDQQLSELVLTRRAQ